MKHLLPFLILLIQLFSCQKDRQLNHALEQAGENRIELQNVIDLYAKKPADSLKLKATKFLIRSMPWHYSTDTSLLEKYRPILHSINKLKDNDHSFPQIRESANKAFDSIQFLYPLNNIYRYPSIDLLNINSKYLIDNIEQALFKFQQSPFRNEFNLKDMFDYVLPHRISDGLANDNWRTFFAPKDSFPDDYKKLSLFQFCDSILANYKKIKFGWKFMNRFPYLKTEDLYCSKYVQCPQRCILNCMILRSKGIPVAIDYVPHCRVHAYGHEWNTLVTKDSIYPFEPFWEKDIWLIGDYYKRKKKHRIYNTFSFPKVYRKTYSANFNELHLYNLKNKIEIPRYFASPFYIDVTHEYFKTFDFDVPLTKETTDKYVYTAIMMGNVGWRMVDFGRIRNNRAYFKSLGPENIYLPVAYSKGTLIPISYPVAIEEDGKTIYLEPNLKNCISILITNYAFNISAINLEMIRNSFVNFKINGIDISDKKIEVFTCKKALSFGKHEFEIDVDHKIKTIKMKLAKHMIINRLSFFDENNEVIQLNAKQIKCAKPLKNDAFRMFDNNNHTQLNTYFIYPNAQNNIDSWIECKFQQYVKIKKILISYNIPGRLQDDRAYELFYWDNEWKSLGTKVSDESCQLTFEEVPPNALYRLRDNKTKFFSRNFTYKNEKQVWW